MSLKYFFFSAAAAQATRENSNYVKMLTSWCECHNSMLLSFPPASGCPCFINVQKRKPKQYGFSLFNLYEMCKHILIIALKAGWKNFLWDSIKCYFVTEVQSQWMLDKKLINFLLQSIISIHIDIFSDISCSILVLLRKNPAAYISVALSMQTSWLLATSL